MNEQMQKFEYCFQKRVYHCPCLRMFVNECFNHGDESVADIDRHWKEFDHRNNLRCEKFFSKIVGEKMEHYLIVCETHLKTLLAGVEKITCTSPENTQILFCFFTKKNVINIFVQAVKKFIMIFLKKSSMFFF